MKPSDYVKLIRDVFSIEPGATLLKEMESELNRNLFDKNPYIHAFNSGQLELVKRMRLIVETPQDDIKLFRKHETIEESQNDY